MKKNLTHILQEGHTHTLSSDKKDALKTHLVAYMNKHPFNAGGVRPIHTSRSIFVLFTGLTRYKYMPIALIIALVLGGGTSYAAEYALPGDTLYPIKINVNEEVRSALAISPEAQAEWDTTRAERRLGEAVTLAAEGKLSAETRTDLQTAFEVHTNQAQTLFAQIEERGRTEEAVIGRTKLEASLQAHSQLLSEVEAEHSDDNTEIGIMLASVQSHIVPVGESVAALAPTVRTMAMMKSDTATENTNEEMSANTGTRTAHDAVTESMVQARMHIASDSLEQVQELFEKFKDDLGTQRVGEVESRIHLAQSAFARGEASFEAKNYAQALASFQETFARSQELRVYITVGARIQQQDADDHEDTVPETEQKNDDSSQIPVNASVGSETDMQSDMDSTTTNEIEIEAHTESDTPDEHDEDNGGLRVHGNLNVDLDI